MRKAYIYVVLTAILFGTMEVACKVAGNHLDPFQLTFLRFAIGGLILLPFAIAEIRQNNVRLDLKDFAMLAFVGTLGVPVSMVFFQLGIMYSNAATASVLISINPLFTMIFAHFFANERLNRYKFIVLLLGLVGLIFMIKPWNMQEGNTVIGMVYMMLAAIFFGAYTVAGKVSVQKMGIMVQTSISFILGSLILLIIILVTGKPVLEGAVEHLPLVLYAGIFVTGIGYFCYFKAIKASDASTGSLAFFIKPAIAPVMAVIFLHETILWNMYVGIACIIIASYMNIRFQRKEKDFEDTLEETLEEKSEEHFEDQRNRKDI